MKKFLIIILTVLMVASFSVAVFGCDNNGGKDPSTPPSTNTFVFEKTEKTFAVDSSGQKFYVKYNGTRITGTELDNVTFSADDPTVISVDSKCEIKPLKLGETYANATYKGLTAKLKVTVSLDDKTPIIVFDNKYVASEMQNVVINNTLDVKANVRYNGKIFTDGVISYSLLDNEFGSVNNGIYTASDLTGSQKITVSATWRGATLASETIEINCINQIFDSNGSEVIYMALYNDQVRKSSDTIKVGNGNDGFYTDDISLVITNPTIASNDNATISATASGVTDVTVKYKEKIVGTFVLEVISSEGKTLIDKSKEITCYIDKDGLALSSAQQTEIFGAETQVIGAEVKKGNATASVTEGKINIQTDKVSLDESYIVAVESATQKVLVKAYSVTKAISKKEDLKIFEHVDGVQGRYSLTTNTEANKFDGIYVVVNDIDCSGFTFDSAITFYTPHEELVKCGNYGLTGILDGLGHKLDNLTLPLSGFGCFSGTIRNIAFEHITLGITPLQSGNTPTAQESHRGTSICGLIVNDNATLENVYFQSDFEYIRYVIGYAFKMDMKAKNVVFNCKNSELGRLISAEGTLYPSDKSEFENFEDVLVISTRPICVPTTPSDAANEKVVEGGSFYDLEGSTKNTNFSESYYTMQSKGIAKYLDATDLVDRYNGDGYGSEIVDNLVASGYFAINTSTGEITWKGNN